MHLDRGTLLIFFIVASESVKIVEMENLKLFHFDDIFRYWRRKVLTEYT